jgi:two-component system osmolarity sensor histidine kinase EnvZ
VTFRSPSLFWRSFLLTFGVSLICLTAWYPTMQMVEQDKRAHQLAARVASLVNVTRLALEFSDPDRRVGLLSDLQEVEGLRIEPRESNDVFLPMEDSALMQRVAQDLQQRLGPATQLASSVNQAEGFWVSFAIDDESFWLRIDLNLLRKDQSRAWIWWAGIATILSLAVTAAITRILNRPLARLARAAAELGRGLTPKPLPDRGPAEIRRTNAYFNRMVDDLQKLAQDRALLLAGVSHDLRTPLTRLRLEIEMAGLPPGTRVAMESDLDQMDQIVQQFLDYAQSAHGRPLEEIDLSGLMLDAWHRAGSFQPPPHPLLPDIQPGIFIHGHRTELARAIENLIVNASRYGRNDAGEWSLWLSLERNPSNQTVIIRVADNGPGIAADQLARLVRPFERGDSARSGPVGAGMGLAIVERIVHMHHGSLAFGDHDGRGLCVEITLPVAGLAQPATQSA